MSSLHWFGSCFVQTRRCPTGHCQSAGAHLRHPCTHSDNERKVRLVRVAFNSIIARCECYAVFAAVCLPFGSFPTFLCLLWLHRQLEWGSRMVPHGRRVPRLDFASCGTRTRYGKVQTCTGTFPFEWTVLWCVWLDRAVGLTLKRPSVVSCTSCSSTGKLASQR